MRPKPWQFILGGCLLAPLPPMLLVWGNPLSWAVCPYALVVMFLRQAQHAYDSLGAAGIPDVVVALLQFPIMGWLLARVKSKGALKNMALQILFWHFIAMFAAMMSFEFRNRVWMM